MSYCFVGFALATREPLFLKVLASNFWSQSFSFLYLFIFVVTIIGHNSRSRDLRFYIVCVVAKASVCKASKRQIHRWPCVASVAVDHAGKVFVDGNFLPNKKRESAELVPCNLGNPRTRQTCLCALCEISAGVRTDAVRQRMQNSSTLLENLCELLQTSQETPVALCNKYLTAGIVSLSVQGETKPRLHTPFVCFFNKQ